MENRPNVILINCDDLGYGDLGCYESKLNRTPCIDQIAKEGVKFTSCYAASPVCSPSRAGMLTSCYPARVNINKVFFPGDKYGLNPNEYTMGQMFKDNGYKTMLIGKWHLGDQAAFMPQKFGFDDFYGLPYSNDMGRQTNHKNRAPLPLMSGTDIVQQQPDQSSLTERYVERAVKFLKETKGKPFFLYFAHMHVHLPLYAARRFESESKNGYFGACVEEIDWATKCLITELKQLGISENTMIIFTSDNGSRADHGASNGVLNGIKGTTWEGGIRVPLIIKYEKAIKGGRVIDNMCSHIDLMPTLANIIGLDLNLEKEIDGMDITKTIKEEVDVRDVFVYYGPYNRPNDNIRKSCLCAIRKGDWKLHLRRRTSEFNQYIEVKELYNLKNDIGEIDNLYSENIQKAKELTILFNDYKDRLGDGYTNIKGRAARLSGEVENPMPLTEYDENHPYIVLMYDKDDEERF